MNPASHIRKYGRESVWMLALGAASIAAAWAAGGGVPPAPSVAGVPVPGTAPSAVSREPGDRASASLPWRLNNPAPFIVPEAEANPSAVADKFAARVRSMEVRAALRAYEGAPPVIPHPIADLNIQTCRACHALGLQAGNKTARMVSHTYLTNCTQCHVEASGPLLGDDPGPANGFVGIRPSGYGGTRAWAGAPPVMPHTTFMRTNCISCHGEHGYDGWRPDHLSRTNCVQCHVPAAEFEQLAPTFGVADVADGQAAGRPR
ncbi:MAG: nitrate reductase cytochrome c-type subunit [Phycisphaerae bacterium]|nr:nitrate reductase cytochrome c-type subunit [Phycisphaerae bacterium]